MYFIYSTTSRQSCISIYQHDQQVKRTSYITSSLSGGFQYRFRVSAENIAGASKPSEPSNSVELHDPDSMNKSYGENSSVCLGLICYGVLKPGGLKILNKYLFPSYAVLYFIN